MLHKPISSYDFGGLFFKELANEDLETERRLLQVPSLGCGQNNLKLGSFSRHTKKVIRGHCTISRILSGTQSLGDKKEQENTVTNFVQSSVF